jgi:hypothetical protein
VQSSAPGLTSTRGSFYLGSRARLGPPFCRNPRPVQAFCSRRMEQLDMDPDTKHEIVVPTLGGLRFGLPQSITGPKLPNLSGRQWRIVIQNDGRFSA